MKEKMTKTITKTKLPAFKGKPLVPETTPQTGFLEGDFGKVFLKEYKGRVNTDYNNNSNLNVLTYNKGVVKGSNPFAVVLANQILKEENLRVATQADLEKALKFGILSLEGTYDTGLVLRTETSPNEYLARNLMKQVKTRRPKQEFPVMISLTDLELRTYQYSSYGLIFDLVEEGKLIYALILNKPGRFNSKYIDEKTGLPKKTGSSGNRYLYTSNSGLSRLCLYEDPPDLGSCDDDMAYSSDSGRVVVVKPKALRQKNLKKKK
jgi:hypothetical protein